MIPFKSNTVILLKSEVTSLKSMHLHYSPKNLGTGAKSKLPLDFNIPSPMKADYERIKMDYHHMRHSSTRSLFLHMLNLPTLLRQQCILIYKRASKSFFLSS